MSISLNCPCGKALVVADEHAGRTAKCPACGAVTKVPVPEPAFEVVEEPDAGSDEGYGVERAVDTPGEDDEPGPRDRRKKRGRSGAGRPRSERAEVLGLARGAELASRLRAKRDARWKARIRLAYIIGALVMIPVGITVAVLGGRGPNSITWIIVGSVVALCGLVAILGLLGILPDQ